ncbi:MAG: response regulator, partial [Dehalococcoidales bacterium]
MEKRKRKTNVLVVDDLQSIRLTLGGILEDEGYNVVTAENGYQAIEAVKKTHFDVIFMDIKMPGINGVQTFR